MTPEELYKKSWHHLMGRGDTFSQCLSFRYEEPNGVGVTGSYGHLFGYNKKNECIFYSAVLLP